MKKSSLFRIDEKVVYTMAAVCLLSIIMLAFRIIYKETDTPVNIIIKDALNDTLLVNDRAHFIAVTKNGKIFEWDFGDGKPEPNVDSSVNHHYTKPGTYTVKVLVDGQNQDIRTVTVLPLKPVFVEEIRPDIRMNGSVVDTATINEEVIFSDVSNNSTTWKWYLKSDPSQVLSFEKTMKYRFKAVGMYVILLKINDKADPYPYYVQIHEKPIPTATPVLGKHKSNKVANSNLDFSPGPSSSSMETSINSEQSPPPHNEPAKNDAQKQAVCEMTDVKLESTLQKIADEIATPESISDCLCGANSNSFITYKKDGYSFSEFCIKLKKINRIKKIKVKTVRGANNCISHINVDIDKRIL